ncbi:hypothetical protein [Rhizobium ruizarguesonis]|uniref:hypothetical protein n=1 Tax=Rhizobium ruizarguesonis TaxID=2081791 RepID=UPI001CF27419|nr:hypothetical protein [Rhizobium ruizarguesonis]MCB2406239.1 hypothetical protein [Rhizobium ruizarguesonis]
MKHTPSFFAAIIVLQVLYSTQTRANDATDVFECSALAEWADLNQKSKKLAELGYRLANEDVGNAIDLAKQSSRIEPSFIQDRSPEFWIGMWYGRSQAKVEEWLQSQYPMTMRAGAAAPERVKIALQRAAVWKPIAAQEFEQRACDFRLAVKD